HISGGTGPSRRPLRLPADNANRPDRCSDWFEGWCQFRGQQELSWLLQGSRAGASRSTIPAHLVATLPEMWHGGDAEDGADPRCDSIRTAGTSRYRASDVGFCFAARTGTEGDCQVD